MNDSQDNETYFRESLEESLVLLGRAVSMIQWGMGKTQNVVSFLNDVKAFDEKVSLELGKHIGIVKDPMI